MAGEFLVMAATLIHIKSRMLLPRPDPAQEDPDEDPREALVRRLLEHQKFKAAAELLHERETLRSAQWTRPDGPIAEIAGEAPEPELEVDLFSLITAFRAVVERAKQRPKVLPAARADPDRRSRSSSCSAAVGDRGVRVRGPVRGRADARRPDRDVPGAARDDPAEAGARVPDRRDGAHPRLQAGAAGRCAASRCSIRKCVMRKKWRTPSKSARAPRAARSHDDREGRVSAVSSSAVSRDDSRTES